MLTLAHARSRLLTLARAVVHAGSQQREEQREEQREKGREERREKACSQLAHAVVHAPLHVVGPTTAFDRLCERNSGTVVFGSLRQIVRMASFRVLEAARAVADEINTLLGNRKLRLIHRAQLRDAAQSIPANIREGMGRNPGAHRNQAYRIARGSAEETDEHLRANFADGRIPTAAYRRIHNRIALVVTILNAIIHD